VVYLHSALAKDWIQAAGRQERQTLLIYSKWDCNTGLGIAGLVKLSMLCSAAAVHAGFGYFQREGGYTRTGSHGSRVHGRETGQWHEANLAVAHRSGRGRAACAARSRSAGVPDSASARRPLGVHEAGGGGAAACRLADERRGFCFTGEMQPNDRSGLAFMIRYAMRHPGRIVPHARRLARDAVLRLRNRDHVSYYRAVMRSDVARGDEGAVGSRTHESWLKIGQMQFDYLVSHGLKPGMRMLEIGCGNLRAGRLFIEHLDAGDYYGIDISPDILLAAQRTLAEAGLQHKLPHLTLVQDLKLEFLPAGYFDVVHAHSVFSHSPIEVIDECLAHVGRVMKPGGFFDFTFDRTEGAEHHVLREDFYYRTETLVALAGRHGLAGQFMKDWEELPHPQSKLRVTAGPSE